MFKHILVPTDGSPLSLKAVKAAAKFAKSERAKITVIHVAADVRSSLKERYNVPAAMIAPLAEKLETEAAAVSRQVLDRACKEVAAAGVKCTGLRVVGDAAYDAIIKQAAKSKCDLIMMASHGRRGLKSVLLGSETQKVLTHSKVPVLVCR